MKLSILAAALLLPATAFLTSCGSTGGMDGGAFAGQSRDGQPLNCPPGFRNVVIDAGHGGHDSGARSPITGALEKELALDVSRRVQSRLGGQFNVLMMRSGDQFIDLDERVVRASRHGGVLVSIHFNHGPSSVAGAETYYWHPGSYSLASRLQRNLAGTAPVDNSRGLVRRRLRLTRNPSIPAVLVECGYLSNSTDARLASDPRHRDRLADAIASAIRETAARGDAGAGSLPAFIPSPPSRPTDARE